MTFKEKTKARLAVLKGNQDRLYELFDALRKENSMLSRRIDRLQLHEDARQNHNPKDIEDRVKQANAAMATIHGDGSGEALPPIHSDKEGKVVFPCLTCRHDGDCDAQKNGNVRVGCPAWVAENESIARVALGI